MAQTIAHFDEAQRVVNTYRLQDVELYFLFGEELDSRWDWAIPLSMGNGAADATATSEPLEPEPSCS